MPQPPFPTQRLDLVGNAVTTKPSCHPGEEVGTYFPQTTSPIAHINEVTPCRARLVLGDVTVREFAPPRSTQPGYPFAGSCNEY